MMTTSAEEVDVSMDKEAAEDVEEDVDEVEEEENWEVLKEEAAHMKMGLTSHISPVTLNIQSGLNFKTKQEKGLRRTHYALTS